MMATEPIPTERNASVRVQTFTPHLAPEVAAFNQRLRAGGVGYQFPEQPTSQWLPKRAGFHLSQEYFLAVEDGGTVRGGYILKRQDFMIHGFRRPVAFYHLPLSEGLIDRRFAALGLRLLTDALKREPALFVLGIGSRSEPLAGMLTALAWQLHSVPFHVRVLRPFRTARRLAYLRRSRLRRLALDVAAFSGAAAMATRFVSRAAEPAEPGITSAEHDDFGDWADAIWADARTQYSVAAVRDRQTLDALYPRHRSRFIRLLVEQRGRPIGWAVLLATDMRQHKYFGSLRVGSIVDGLARREDAHRVVTAAVQCLRERGVDLIVSNQASSAWTRGLERGGFVAGPSTFLFGASKALAALAGADLHLGDYHLNRGDGDGPINL
jgi:hypothetical protein